MNHPAEAQVIWVGEFRLDRLAQRLWRNENPIDLVPQVWTLLSLMVERAGQLVTKDEILATAWAGVAVSDAALSQAVRRLREVFGDDARKPRYVETVHRRGFRLIAPIRADAAAADSHPRGEDDASLFVGRALELGRLQESLAAAHAGLRRVVFIEGDAGIGKTALLRSFLSSSVRDTPRVAAAQCVEQQGPAEPYMPVLEALDRLARSDPAALDVLHRYAPTWLLQMPWLLAGNEAHDLERSITDATRGRMLREMARALEVLSAEDVLVLLLEDLHWADRATVDFLLSIARRPDAARLLIVGTYRAAEAIAYEHPIVACVRNLWTGGACTRLSLESLTPAEVHGYLTRRFTEPEIATQLAEGIHVRTEGNPLFLVAMVDHLVERGFVTEHAGRWQLARPVEAADLRNIPNSVREMIELQLASLEPSDLELLQAASVAAVEFRAASVAAALASSGPGDLEAVERACDFLSERRQLLRATDGQVWPDGTRTARYRFRHDLYRQVLYDRISAGQRARLHQRIGERIEDAFASDPMRVAAELVTHFSRSGDDTRAVRYALLAAEQARRRYAVHEAAIHLRDALRHLENLPPGADRDFNELQLRTNLLLAQTYTHLEQPDADERNFDRITTLAALPAARDVFPVQHTLTHVYCLRSMPTQAAAIADRLAALADPALTHEQMEAFAALAAVRMMQGRCGEALEAAARAVELFGDGDPPACAGFPGYETKWREAGATMFVQLASALFGRGFIDQALRHLDRAIDLCARRVRPYWAAATVSRAAGVLCLRGDRISAQNTSDRGLAIAADNGIEHQIRIAAPQRVWLAIMAGKRKDARARIRAAWEDYLASHRFVVAPIGPLFLLDACRVVGAGDDGIAIADEIWSVTRANGVRWYDAELQRLRGELLLVQGARTTATAVRACFDRALEIARQQGHRFYELRAATSLARFCRGGPDEHAARAELERTYAELTEGLETPDMQAAAALLVPKAQARKKRTRADGGHAA